MLIDIPSPLCLPWVIYTLGHGKDALHRALTLAYVAAANRQVLIVSNSKYSSLAQAQISQKLGENNNVSIHPVSDSDRDISPEDVQLQISQLFAIAPFVLIVDALPNGFYDELPSVLTALTSIPKVLILRDLKPTEAIAHNLNDLIENQYDLAIAPGRHEAPSFIFDGLTPDLTPGVAPDNVWPSAIKKTQPWLDCSPGDLRDKAIARSLIGIEKDDKAVTVLVLASGEAAEMDVYGYVTSVIAQQCPWVNVRCLSRSLPANCPIELWVTHWPEMEAIQAADLVIGAGDYSTVYACQALKIPLIAFPWTRPDDLQRSRLDRVLAARESNIRGDSSHKARMHNAEAAKLEETLLDIVTSPEEALSSTFAFLNRIIEMHLSDKQPAADPTHHPENHSEGTLVKPPERDLEARFINGAVAAVELIESAIAAKWHAIAHAVMTREVTQFRADRDHLYSDEW